ncbi:MAG: hypothetical protein M1821_008563 [Bathelium mastoideum]|nr:MAG: hypothetical protein M1821_008563 [Bathelium mastoideum]
MLWLRKFSPITCFLGQSNAVQIVSGTAQLLDGAHQVARNLPKASVQSFEVLREGKFFTLHFGESDFARLNKALSRVLNLLLEDRRIRVKAYVRTEDILVEPRKLNTTRPVAVELNVYGLRADAEFVGETLSGSGVFLQYPNSGRDDVEYYNPHFLRIEGFPDSVLEESFEPATGGAPSSSAQQHSTEEDRQINDSVVLDDILDSLSHHVTLRHVHIDGRIKSTLLQHQREAFDFASQREAGQLPSELSLWRRNEIDADEPFYQHVFTGAKRPQQSEAMGGIIADEMGLGKSLVMLSLVAGSLGRAEEFVTAQNKLLGEGLAKKIPSKATLVLAPSSLLIDNWVDEIRKHTYAGGLPFHKHIGQARHAETDRLREYMIVFTTYATVATEHRHGNSVLSNINWFRIVLDEAHDIRNRSTKQFQAIASLSAKHRWCLTGTPIQNTLEDLGSLVSFLKVPILENVPTFRKFIINPIISTAKGRFQNLGTLLQTICIRRTREVLNLPEPVVQLRRLPLTEVERAEYDDLLREGRMKIDMAVSGHARRSVESTVLESLLRLRLFCNNGSANADLMMGLNGLPSDPEEALSYLQQFEQNICAYCNATVNSINGSAENDTGMLIPSCTHLVCPICMPDHIEHKRSCPICLTQTEGSSSATSESSTPSQVWANSQPARPLDSYPSKLRALISDLWNDGMQKRYALTPNFFPPKPNLMSVSRKTFVYGERLGYHTARRGSSFVMRLTILLPSIVFSSWKNTLKLVGQMLFASNMRYTSIDGSLKLAQRRKVLDDFRSPRGANILLMTLGTGAVGLNLAVASRIYLLEPQWNPSIESQAIGRALRLGQTDRVVIKRYIMMDTVEESNVLSRQRRKLQLAGGGFSKSSSSDEMQSMLDVFSKNLNA